MRNSNDLSGKTIVFTGSASGIGAGTAQHLKELGAQVIGADINTSTSVDDSFHLDLSVKSSIDEFIEKLPNQIDGLANVAGLPPTAPPEQVIKVNLVGPMYLTHQLISRLKDGSAIVNVSSIAASRWHESVDQIKDACDLDFDTAGDFVEKYQISELPGRAYFLTKEALLVWTLRQRKAWLDRNIRMNCVSPGAVSTPLFDGFAEVFGDRAKEDIGIVERHGAPEDIAPVIAFLLSEASHWLRGTNIHADGGVASHYLAEEYGL